MKHNLKRDGGKAGEVARGGGSACEWPPSSDLVSFCEWSEGGGFLALDIPDAVVSSIRARLPVGVKLGDLFRRWLTSAGAAHALMDEITRANATAVAPVGRIRRAVRDAAVPVAQ